VSCEHKLLAPEVVDQTLGVKCLDCDVLVAVCWDDDQHIPETLWNRACANDPNFIRTEHDRPDVCALCEATIEVKAGDETR
jgi:hypothetical protein